MKDKDKALRIAAAGVAGAAILLTRAQAAPPGTDPAPDLAAAASNGEKLQNSDKPGGYDFGTAAAEAPEVRVVPHVSGTFSFDQDVLSPNDQVFSIFGTALTGLCAKPFFVFESDGESTGRNEVEVRGDIKNAYTVNLSDVLKEKEQQRTMLCSCSSGPAIATARVTGVLLEDVIDVKALGEGVNTITVYGEDGYGFPMPLRYVLDKKAMIVFKANGLDIPSGTQLWIPDTVSQYYTRKIVSIQLTKEENVPEISKARDEQRAKIKIVSSMKGGAFKTGQEIMFEGYADDLGVPITAIEFSMDNGETWTAFSTDGASGDKWVYWYFTFVPENAGTYKLTARARTAEGLVSQTVSEAVFYVETATAV